MIIDIVRSVSMSFPDKRALCDATTSLTYREVEAHTNQLAARLTKFLGVEFGDVLAVELPRGVNQYLLMTAIFKLGAFYLPLDPNVPGADRRREQVLADIKMDATFSNKQCCLLSASVQELPDSLATIGIKFTSLEQFFVSEPPEVASADSMPPAVEGGGYIVYSSGTTGQPKGMVLGLSGLEYWYSVLQQKLKTEELSPVVVGGVTSWNFDPHIWEWLMALSLEGCLQVAEAPQCANADSLVAFIKERGISHLTLTPSKLMPLLASAKQKNVGAPLSIFSTGEACTREIVAGCSNLGWSIWNCYGPSEVNFGASILKVEEDMLSAEGGVPVAQPETPVAFQLQQQEGDSKDLILHIQSPFLARYIGGRPMPGKGDVFRTDDIFSQAGEVFFCHGRESQRQNIQGVLVDLDALDKAVMKALQGEEVLTALSVMNDRCVLTFVSVMHPVTGVEAALLKSRILKFLQTNGVPLIACSAEINFIHQSRWPSNSSNGKVDKSRLLAMHKSMQSEWKSDESKLSLSWLGAPLHQVAAVWGKMFGLEADGINFNLGFTAHGGNSVLVQTFQARLQDQLGLDLDLFPSQCLLFASVTQIAFAVKYKVPIKSVLHLNIAQLRLMDFHFRSFLLCRHQSRAFKITSIFGGADVSLNGNVLIYMPPVTGSIREYLNFLVADRSLKGCEFVAMVSPLRNESFTEAEKAEYRALAELPEYCNVTELAYHAATAIAAMKSPSLRIHILGWSFGGLTASLACHYLSGVFDQEVRSLALGDSDHPVCWRGEDELLQFVDRLLDSLVSQGFGSFADKNQLAGGDVATVDRYFKALENKILLSGQCHDLKARQLLHTLALNFSMIANELREDSSFSKSLRSAQSVTMFLASGRDKPEACVNSWRENFPRLQAIQLDEDHNHLLEAAPLKKQLAQLVAQDAVGVPSALSRTESAGLSELNESLIVRWQNVNPVKCFHGRKDLLQNLIDTGKSVSQIVGTYGLGKTQVAANLSAKMLALGLVQSAIWLHVDKGISNEWNALATVLGLNYNDATFTTPDTLVKSIMFKLDRYGLLPCLLVLDNVDAIADVQPYLQALEAFYGKGLRVVITSRDTSMNIADSFKPNLEVFSSKEGAGYVIAALDLDEEASQMNAERISDLLGGLPLALTQVIAYLSVSKVDLCDYANTYKGVPREALTGNVFANDPHPKNLYVTTKLCVDLLNSDQSDVSQAAGFILDACCFLQAANIPVFLLKKYCEKKGVAGGVFEAAMDGFVQRGFVQTGGRGDERFLRMHRIIQAICKEKFLSEAGKRIVEDFLEIFREIFNDCRDRCTVNSSEWYDLIKRYYPHLREVWGAFQVVVETNAGNVELNSEQSASLVLPSDLAYDMLDVVAFFNMRLHDGAALSVKTYEQMLKIVKASFGEAHWSVAFVLNELSIAYGDIGQNPKQKELLEQALSIMGAYFSKDHWAMAPLYENRANIYGVFGDTKNFQDSLLKALAINKQHFGEGNFRLVTTLHNLAVSCLEVGGDKLEEAASYALAALKISVNQFGEDFSRGAITHHLLANIFAIQGDCGKQKAHLDNAYQLNLVHRGESFFYTALDVHALGFYHGEVGGDLQKQIDMLVRSNKILRSHFPEETWIVATSDFSLAHASFQQDNDSATFINCCIRCHKIMAEQFGKDYWRSLLIRYRWLEVKAQESELDQAEQEEYVQAKSSLQSRFGKLVPARWHLTFEVLALPLMNYGLFSKFMEEMKSEALADNTNSYLKYGLFAAGAAGVIGGGLYLLKQQTGGVGDAGGYLKYGLFAAGAAGSAYLLSGANDKARLAMQ